jgi:electron transfer flavoprotein beta subunit
LKIVVCVKVVPKIEEVRFNPETKTVDRSRASNELNEADKNALESALQIKQKIGGEVVTLSMGPPFFEPFLKLCVAMGADDAVLVSDPVLAAADTYATSYVLAQAIKKIGFDLVLCGESTADSGTGQVPPQISEWLGVPNISYASRMDVIGRKIIVKRTIRNGYEIVESELPALVSVELGSNTPRFPDFKRKRWADREFQLKVWTAADLGVELDKVGRRGSKTDVIALKELSPTERRREFITGSVEEVAAKLADIIRMELGSK